MAAMPALCRVSSRREFIDTLERMNSPPKPASQKMPEPRGRMTELKTYMLEAREWPQSAEGEKISWEIEPTGVDKIKIISVRYNGAGADSGCQFYLDVSDKRFSLLHTNMLASRAGDIVKDMVNDHVHNLDHTWFYSDMMRQWMDTIGDFGGCTISRPNVMKMRLPRTKEARRMHEFLESSWARRYMHHSSILVHRGGQETEDGYVNERITNTGYFSLKQGRSIRQHLDIIGVCKDEYASKISQVEEQQLGMIEKNGRTELVGKPFVISFENPIPDLEPFLEKMFNSGEPYKLWGMVSKNEENYYNVAAIDLHEESTIDFEVTPTMMRIYMHRGSCGNTLLRLFTNLQMHCDTQIRCKELN